MEARRGTSTSSFGVSGRESHDASAFYGRFHAPVLSDDATVLPPTPVAEPFVCGDARSMTTVADGSVALVVTSPPYFAGKQYEEELDREGVPSSYLEYLEMLRDVFRDCVRALEPGGRIAVNVANLGRKPYRSLSADVIGILQDDLGLLLRGELIWQKAEGATGSCAWGSFRSAANPVLRDVTERVVVASKGRFDRARTVKQRAAEGLPHESTLLTEDFTALTLDVWSIPPESATRVRHPAPFPVELPQQLIRLLTYRGDLVLDPFMGSGSALVAAARLDRRYVGYDLDPTYVEIASARVAEVIASVPDPTGGTTDGGDARAGNVSRGPTASLPGDAGSAGGDGSGTERGGGARVERAGAGAGSDGRGAQHLAVEVLVEAGFEVVGRDVRVRGSGAAVAVRALDGAGRTWWFDVAGPHTSHRGGMLRSEVVWRSLGRAAALRGALPDGEPLALLTTQLPRPRSDGDRALRAAGPGLVFDAVGLLDAADRARLARYGCGTTSGPEPGFWTPVDLASRPRLR